MLEKLSYSGVGIKMDNSLKELLSLDFDQFSRIYEAKMAVEQLRNSKEKLKILDVGGYKGNTSQLFPQDNVTVVDQYDVREDGYVKANAMDLPFMTGEFDVVLSFDVFEHILPHDRIRFLEELVRVSSRLTIIAAPFSTESNELAETLTNDFYKKIASKDHPWLIEHIDNTLPEEHVIDDYLKAKKLKYRVARSNEIVLWTYMQHYILLTGAEGVSIDPREVNRFYNINRDSLDIVGDDFYRSVYIIGKKTMPRDEKTKTVGRTTSQINLASMIFRDIADILLEKNKTISKLNCDLVTLSEEKSVILQEINAIKQSRSWRFARLPGRLASILTGVVKNGK